jgi:hypothetical protein
MESSVQDNPAAPPPCQYTLKAFFKGIVQPFELGGETRLIRSTVKY